MAPKLDNRTREDILEQIEELAASYTPGWRFNREQPDMGSTLAILYAGMMEETIACFNQMYQRDRLAFLNALGADVIPARNASGYMSFGLTKPDMPEAVLPPGTAFAVEGKQGGQYELLEEVYVSAAMVELWAKPEENTWYFQFSKAPEQGLISLLFILKQWESTREEALLWEYFGTGGWSLLQVEDETEGMSHTGIIRFTGTPDFRETSCGSRSGFWIRVFRAEKGVMPAAPVYVGMNSGKARAQNPGKKGNLHPKEKFRLLETVGYVSRLVNPDGFHEGTNEETKEHGITRSSAAIRHRSYAVTPGDFECLIREVCMDAVKVKCFSGYDGSGNKCPGSVTVVVLQENFREGRHYFYKTEEQIRTYLKDRAESILLQAGSLFVKQPQLIRISVQAELCVNSYRYVLQTEKEACHILEQFLDPIKGGYDETGWEFGILPEYIQIKRHLQHLPEVVFVGKMWMTYEREENGFFREVEEKQVRQFAWALPFGGSHQIAVKVSGR